MSTTILPVAWIGDPTSTTARNGDGHPDLFLPCRGELLSPREKRPANDNATINLTDGRPDLVRRQDVPVGFWPYTAVIGDLDGDGLNDVVVANFQSNDGRDISILYGSPDRKKVAGTRGVRASGPPSLPYLNLRDAEGQPVYPTPGLNSVAITDFHHDGRPDLAAVGWSVDKLLVFLNDGQRRFRQASYSVPPGPSDLAMAEFNGDGNPDIAVTLYSTNLYKFGPATGVES
jgi:hypothetical protein